MMKHIIKPLNFKKAEGAQIYYADVNISDIVHLGIIVHPDSVTFTNYNYCKYFNFDPHEDTNVYTKYGFNNVEEAKMYAIRAYEWKMSDFIDSFFIDTINDIKKYVHIDEIKGVQI